MRFLKNSLNHRQSTNPLRKAKISSNCCWQKFREISVTFFFQLISQKNLQFHEKLEMHTVKITEIYSHTFLGKLSWKQVTKRVDFTKNNFGESEFLVYVDFHFHDTFPMKLCELNVSSNINEFNYDSISRNVFQLKVFGHWIWRKKSTFTLLEI